MRIHSSASVLNRKSYTRCTVEELEALERLYVATNGARWQCGRPGRPCKRTPPPGTVAGAAQKMATVGGGQEPEMGLAWAVGAFFVQVPSSLCFSVLVYMERGGVEVVRKSHRQRGRERGKEG